MQIATAQKLDGFVHQHMPVVKANYVEMLSENGFYDIGEETSDALLLEHFTCTQQEKRGKKRS